MNRIIDLRFTRLGQPPSMTTTQASRLHIRRACALAQPAVFAIHRQTKRRPRSRFYVYFSSRPRRLHMAHGLPSYTHLSLPPPRPWSTTLLFFCPCLYGPAPSPPLILPHLPRSSLILLTTWCNLPFFFLFGSSAS